MKIEIPTDTKFLIDFRTIGREKFVPLGEFDLDSATELLREGKVTYYSRPDIQFHYGYIYFVQIANLEYQIRSSDYAPSETYLSA